MPRHKVMKIIGVSISTQMASLVNLASLNTVLEGLTTA